LGASVGGLMAARALTAHFERVTILERDRLPSSAEPRRGAPQARHAHALLAGGLQAIDRFFPGLSIELVEGGGVAGDPARTGGWHEEGGWMARVDSGIRAVMVSRPLLELSLRRRLISMPNVRIHENCEAKALTPSPDKSRVSGVEGMRADLVIDATGRGSRSDAWLEDLGYRAPEIEKIEVNVAYTSRTFVRRTGQLNGDNFAVIPADLRTKRGGVALSLEEDRWIVTLNGYFGESAPTNIEGFREFAQSLPAPTIYHLVRDAEPACDGISSRFPASVRRRVERLSRYPEGFLTFGDAICSFNPVYGQGMSVAALEAEALDACLLEGDANLARRFFRRAANVIDNPWSIAAGSDLRFPETGGRRSPRVRFVNWYVSRLLRASHRNAALSLAFHRVGNLLAPPETLFAPRTAGRVLLHGVLAGRPRSSVLAAEIA
jgi:2-polyprenyl-6-methoxyphenol hydroxylase-like FAD-dependent oxidoreductase